MNLCAIENVGTANRADERFILFMRTVESPITENAIALFYAQYVMRADSFCGRHLSDPTFEEQGLKRDVEEMIRGYAIEWFDRSLGRAIRKRLLPTLPQLAFSKPTPLRLRNKEDIAFIMAMDKMEAEGK